MVVAIQRGLGPIKKQLSELGHKVVTYGDYNAPIDAVVYVGGFSQMTALSGSHFTDYDGGILMINAQGKTAEEIDTILRRRSYSPLF